MYPPYACTPFKLPVLSQAFPIIFLFANLWLTVPSKPAFGKVLIQSIALSYWSASASKLVRLPAEIHPDSIFNEIVEEPAVPIEEPSLVVEKFEDETFDYIYIDGSHFYEDVKKDFINSLNCIEKGGILICDDFLWFYYNNLAHNPIVAIIECYEKFKNDLEILFINHQIIFKKIN